MAFIGVFSAKLNDVGDEIKEVAISVSRVIVEHIGGISTDARGRPWFSLN
jgi:hypothetical protein